MISNHFIAETEPLLSALKQINSLSQGPLVLFVLDKNDCMVGTLTDGDARRALISGKDLQASVSEVMHRNFNFLRKGINDGVEHIKAQKQLQMRLIPVLDESNRVVDIINLAKYKTKLPIDAVIMAGGKGERLRPLTEKTPKPLLKVGDKSIIDYNVDTLISCGVEHINVTVNYLKEQIEAHYQEPHLGVQVNVIPEPKFLGTIASVLFVKKFYNDTVLLMNSDVFTSIDFEDFYLHFKTCGADMSAAAFPYDISVPYGVFDLDGRNINGVLEKPCYNHYINAGIYLIKTHLLKELIPANTFFNATDFIEALIAKGKKVVRYPITGYWLDIGSHQEYQKAQELVKHIQNV